MSPKSSPPADRGRFFIIGAQRSGTSYLYELLDEHPDVAMAKPNRPEPKWFLNPEKAAKGGEAWERALFAGTSARLLGEKGTSYIEYPDVTASILAAFPEARFIAILREPISRAVSNYRFSVDHHLETLPVGQALTPEAEERPYDPGKSSVSPFAYLRRGRYADYLEGWAARITRERLCVVLLEEFAAGGDVFSQLCRFLAIAPYEPKSMGRIVNAASAPVPGIPAELRKRLREYYRESNARLERFLHRRLDLWDQ